ncbi:DUF4065 domain-containing protein [Acidaminobacter sp. JC074]|uniref:type II TA system antitoxin MqsA family protein n=1 Tax=Acidaminobacter sp. JC074 TaxID=2530199 RepID=UPI001F0E1315|nr:type II TA system antitoxin MqsA family protein [Acidaminobacter sp. JC074]MCH4891140.1 DUF4065 domain-containing protein [Acidaminobacter sp. JC074]
MNMLYCDNCKEDREIVIKKNMLRMFKGVEVNVEEQIAFCIECGNELVDKELEKDNLSKIYKKYRDVCDLISGQEIVEFRQKHGLSQRELTCILDLGKMTINRYENGSLPSKSNSQLLRHVFNNEEVFLAQSKKAYEAGRIKEKTYKKIEANSHGITKYNLMKQVIDSMIIEKPSEYNGFKSFDYDKTECLIGYLSKRVNLTITSVNKYLWYIDFAYFKKYTKSLTGIVYIKEKYGPVVKERMYDSLVVSNRYVETHEEEDGDFRRKSILNLTEIDSACFNEKELEIINLVIDSFKDLRVKDISDLSHKEKAWMETELKEKISYSYAFDLIRF